MAAVNFSDSAPDFPMQILDQVRSRTKAALIEVAEIQGFVIRNMFSHDGARKGTRDKWKKTSRVAALKRKNPPSIAAVRAGNYLTMVDSGRTRDSIKILDVSESRNSIEILQGSDSALVKPHHEGSTLKVGRKTFDVPARPYLFLTDFDAREAERMLKLELND